MLTPLPPACEITDSARCTAPRSRRPAEGDRAVVAGVGRQGDDHATTTSMPARSGRGGRRRLMASSVTRTSMSSRVGEAERRLDADLAWRRPAARRTPCARDHGALGGGLVAVGGGQAVADADPVGAEEERRRRAGGSGPRRCRRRRRPGWSGGPGRAAGAGRSGVAGQPGGDRHGVGDHGEAQVAGEQAGEPVWSWSRRREHGRARGGQQVERRAGDPLLLLGVGLVALAEPGLDRRRGCRRHRAAVDAADQAHPLEGGEVAAHGLGGDVVLRGE